MIMIDSITGLIFSSAFMVETVQHHAEYPSPDILLSKQIYHVGRTYRRSYNTSK